MSDLLASILGGLTEALVGGLVGFLVAYFAFRLRRDDRVIEYYRTSFALLEYEPSSALQITVPETILVGDADGEKKRVPVETAYGFSIKMENVGNQVVDDCTVEVQLDRQAKIVDCRTAPKPKPRYELCAERDQEAPNIERLFVPYINPGDTVSVHILSVNNADDACQVEILAKGVEVRERDLSRASFSELVEAFRETTSRLGTHIVVILGTLLLYGISEELLKAVPGVGRMEQREVFLAPLWFHLAFLLIISVQLFFFLREFLRFRLEASANG